MYCVEVSPHMDTILNCLGSTKMRRNLVLLLAVGAIAVICGEASAGVCKDRQVAFNKLASQDAAVLARMKAAAAANNCAGVIAAGNARIAVLQRAASMRSSVVNCEDATHINSDRDPPGYDAREIAFTRNVIAACNGTASRTAATNTPPPAKPVAPPADSRAVARGSDCSDVSGTGAPRIQCSERRPAAPPTPKRVEVKPETKPVTHTENTGTATRLMAEFFPEAAQVTGRPKEEPKPDLPPSSPAENTPAVVAPSPELTAARESLAEAARIAQEHQTCSTLQAVVTRAKDVVSVYEKLGDTSNATAMAAKAGKVERVLAEMRSTDTCDGSRVAARHKDERKGGDSSKLTPAQCVSRMAYLKTLDEGAVQSKNTGGRSQVALMRLEMLSSGNCNEDKYKPDLRECLTAKILWADAKIGEQEIERRLRAANCPPLN